MSLYPNFARPRSLSQASELLGDLSAGTVIIAGGQEIMPSVNMGTLQPDVYVDIGGLPELRGIEIDDATGKLSIGALTVHRELQTNELIGAHAPLLAQSARKAGGGRQVHNRGTIGGNIVAMHPLYDIAPSLLAMDAEVETLKGGELTRAPLRDVIADTKHGLGSEAILVRVLLTPMADGLGFAYEKLKMSGGSYGSANAAAIVGKRGENISSVRLIVGAVAEQLMDASEAAAFLVGQSWSQTTAERLKTVVSERVSQPLSDQQGMGEWRTAMAGVVAARACAAALESATGESN